MHSNKLKARPFDRMYLQYFPDAEAAEQFKALQELLEGSGITGRFIGLEKLHLTVLHIGVVPAVYAQVLAANAHLSAKTFDEALDELVIGLHTVQPSALHMQPTALELMGRGEATIVLGLEKSDAFRETYVRSLQLLQRFLSRCGVVTSPLTLKPLPRAIQFHGPATQPHVSLVRAARPPRLLKLPNSLVAAPMSFTKAPITY